MRFAIGMFAHETNTFCPGFTELEAFQAREWEVGDEIIANNTGVRNDLGGMIAAAETLGIELAPTLATTTQPSATVSCHAYETIRDTLFAQLQAVGEVDAICLTLHGAGTADGIDDMEGTFLQELRALVGYEIPIVVSLDLHGNTTQTMLDNATALFYCHEYPHIDMYERGYEIVEVAAGIVAGTIVPTMHLEILPAIIPTTTSFSGPVKTINERCFAWEEKPGVLDCNFTHGFPHTDVSVVHTSVLVVTNNDAALAKEIAQDIATFTLGMLDEFIDTLPGAEEAVQLALAATELPVVIAEVSDNCGGGAPGDGTHLLRALLAANEPDTAFGFIVDAEVAAQAHDAGVGATIAIRLGGRTDELHGAPIETEAYVKVLTDGEFVLTTPMGAGQKVGLGKMARLVIGNVDVIVGSRRAQTFDPEVFQLHGIDVRRLRIAALKSQQHFRAGFEPIAGTVIRADPPGLTTSTLTHLPYARISRPIWPLDPIA